MLYSYIQNFQITLKREWANVDGSYFSQFHMYTIYICYFLPVLSLKLTCCKILLHFTWCLYALSFLVLTLSFDIPDISVDDDFSNLPKKKKKKKKVFDLGDVEDALPQVTCPYYSYLLLPQFPLSFEQSISTLNFSYMYDLCFISKLYFSSVV